MANASGDQGAMLVAPHRPSLWLLLGTLVVLQFGYPITLRGQGWGVVYLLAYGGSITFALRTASRRPRRYWPIYVTTAALVVGATLFAFDQDSLAATAAMLVGVGVLDLSLLIALVATLLSPPALAHTLDLLLVAVCAYLLMGGVFGVSAALLEIAQPGSFADSAVDVVPLPWQSLFYGSYVTLATLGFGDVTPVSAWARSLLSFEAVLGTLFVAVVIARLVGVAGLAPRDRGAEPASE